MDAMTAHAPITPDFRSPARMVKKLARGAVIENVNGRAMINHPTWDEE
jgi:hypothetical protein